MGVLACSRRGCENIMCDRHSNKHGTICDECFEELQEGEIKTRRQIDEFMDSEKVEFDTLAKHDYYNNIFPILR